VCTFATLPVVGLYLSLSRKHFLTAWLETIAICVVLPWCVTAAFLLFGPMGMVVNYSSSPSSSWQDVLVISNLLVLASGVQITNALIAFMFLFRNLRLRKFALTS